MSDPLEQQRTVAIASIERRRTPRLELISRIIGEWQAADQVVVLNVSDGGLMVESTRPAVVGEVHEFRFQTGEGRTLVFAARVMHVSAASNAERASFTLGVRFEPGTDRQRAAVAVLIAECESAGGRAAD